MNRNRVRETTLRSHSGLLRRDSISRCDTLRDCFARFSHNLSVRLLQMRIRALESPLYRASSLRDFSGEALLAFSFENFLAVTKIRFVELLCQENVRDMRDINSGFVSLFSSTHNP